MTQKESALEDGELSSNPDCSKLPHLGICKEGMPSTSFTGCSGIKGSTMLKAPLHEAMAGASNPEGGVGHRTLASSSQSG